MTSKRRHGRIALVTGGAKGFGQAIARRLATDGHDVAVLDIADTEQTAALVRSAGARFVGLRCDITSRAQIDHAAQAVELQLGPTDVLIANAGIYPIVPFFETSWETWRRVMDVNLDGTFHLFQRFVPGMAARGWGRVVALISGTVFSGPPNVAAYVASKAAIIGLVRTVAREVGPFGVTVNSVAPPLVETPGVAAGPQRQAGVFDIVLNAQTIKREGVAEDVAGPIAFLVSDDASFVTGQSIVTDGGMHFL